MNLHFVTARRAVPPQIFKILVLFQLGFSPEGDQQPQHKGED